MNLNGPGAEPGLDVKDSFDHPIADAIFTLNMDQACRDAAGMEAVPEPSAVLLLGIGLAALGVLCF